MWVGFNFSSKMFLYFAAIVILYTIGTAYYPIKSQFILLTKIFIFCMIIYVFIKILDEGNFASSILS